MNGWIGRPQSLLNQAVRSNKQIEPHENLVWSDLLKGTKEITAEVIPRGSAPTIIVIDLHTGLAHALEAVDKTEGVIIETVDKIPLAPEE
jgi:hypothetical protein